MRTVILSGSGSVAGLRELKSKRLFLVTDPYFAENGTAKRIGEASGAEAVEVFSEVSPDPSLTLAAKGADRFRKFRPDLLAALGGGSALDLGKAIRYFGGRSVPFAAIPTTSGSGSEVTNFAILTHQGQKQPLVDDSLQPDYAILDSDLLEKLPKPLIADAGFDVLSHALEAWVGKAAGEMSDLYGEKAFCMALSALPGSYAGDLSQRMPMHLAADFAGIAFSQAGLGLCHALSHSLGARFHVPHGRLNSILLPEVIEANSLGAGEKYALLARRAGLGGSAQVLGVRNLKNTLIRLRRQLQLPKTLAEAGISPERLHSSLQGIVEGTLQDPCCGTNPVPVTEAVVRQVLQRVAGHG